MTGRRLNARGIVRGNLTTNRKTVVLRDTGMRGSYGRKIYSGTFTPPHSEAAMVSKVAGKRRKWYVEPTSPTYRTFSLYDSKMRYVGSFTEHEIFGQPVKFVGAVASVARRKRKTKRSKSSKLRRR